MIVIDTSALVALLAREPEALAMLERILAADVCALSAGTFIEASIVLNGGRFGPPGVAMQWLDDFIHERGVIIEPVTAEHAHIARAAYRIYGKGTGHPASLNFGDCFAYALAKALDAPLLYKGDDFSRTDIRSALT